MIIFIMTTGDHFCQNSNRIGNSAAIGSTMQITVGACYFYFDIT